MAVLVWATVAIAIWHFTVFVPDRFWGGIIGAFLGAVAGALMLGTVGQLISGESVGNTDITTALVGALGAAIGLAATYAYGVRRENEQARLAEQRR